MKRTIGIVLIVVGVIVGILGITSHDDDKTLVDFGKVEIKANDKSPSKNTTMYYIIAAVCVVAGGVMLSGKRA